MPVVCAFRVTGCDEVVLPPRFGGAHAIKPVCDPILSVDRAQVIHVHATGFGVNVWQFRWQVTNSLKAETSFLTLI